MKRRKPHRGRITIGIIVLFFVSLSVSLWVSLLCARSIPHPSDLQSRIQNGLQTLAESLATPRKNGTTSLRIPLIQGPLSQQIAEAQEELAKTIQAENVSPSLLKKFYSQYRFHGDSEALLLLPEKTSLGFRKLHGLLTAASQQMLKADGKGAEFTQAPVSRSLPPALVEHALYLEKLSVGQDVQDFVNQRSTNREITNEDILRVAQLCAGNGSCIEKAAYTWIKANHMLTLDQHRLIQTYLKGA